MVEWDSTPDRLTLSFSLKHLSPPFPQVHLKMFTRRELCLSRGFKVPGKPQFPVLTFSGHTRTPSGAQAMVHYSVNTANYHHIRHHSEKETLTPTISKYNLLPLVSINCSSPSWGKELPSPGGYQQNCQRQGWHM